MFFVESQGKGDCGPKEAYLQQQQGNGMTIDLPEALPEPEQFDAPAPQSLPSGSGTIVSAEEDPYFNKVMSPEPNLHDYFNFSDKDLGSEPN